MSNTEMGLVQFLPTMAEKFVPILHNGVCAHCDAPIGDRYITARAISAYGRAVGTCVVFTMHAECLDEFRSRVAELSGECDDCGDILTPEWTTYLVFPTESASAIDSAANDRMIGIHDILEITFTLTDPDSTFSFWSGVEFCGWNSVGDHGIVCNSCFDTFAYCANCGTITYTDDMHSCEECGSLNCEDCGDCCEYEDREYCSCGCGEVVSDGYSSYSDHYSISSHDFTMALEAARANTERGEIVRSLRPFGVEFEQAGGSRVADELQALEPVAIAEAKEEHCGDEFVSVPLSGAPGEAGVRAVLGVLRRGGYAPTPECGTHFHVDMGKANAKAIWRVLGTLALVEPHIYAFTYGRENATWCKPFVDMYVQQTPMDFFNMAANADVNIRFSPYDAQSRGRYAAINSFAFDAHGTIEIRALDGCADATRILHMVAFVTAMVDIAMAAPMFAKFCAGFGKRGAEMLQSFAVARGYMTQATRDYLAARIAAGNGPDCLRTVTREWVESYGSEARMAETRASRIRNEFARANRSYLESRGDERRIRNA